MLTDNKLLYYKDNKFHLEQYNEYVRRKQEYHEKMLHDHPAK